MKMVTYDFIGARNRDGSLGVLTRLDISEILVRLPADATEFPLLQSAQTGSGAYQDGALPRELK
jgi:hypothetical protein